MRDNQLSARLSDHPNVSRGSHTAMNNHLHRNVPKTPLAERSRVSGREIHKILHDVVIHGNRASPPLCIQMSGHRKELLMQLLPEQGKRIP